MPRFGGAIRALLVSAGAFSFLASALGLLAGGCTAAYAQANNIEEGGVVEKRAEPAAINDAAFDCAAFKQALDQSRVEFAALRGAPIKSGDSLATFAATQSLFGECQILLKPRVNENSYSCQSDKFKIADLKATIEACLGDKANGMAGNENPNTPYLRYNPDFGDQKGRIIVLTTFGKQTLSIFNPR